MYSFVFKFFSHFFILFSFEIAVVQFWESCIIMHENIPCCYSTIGLIRSINIRQRKPHSNNGQLKLQMEMSLAATNGVSSEKEDILGDKFKYQRNTIKTWVTASESH